MRPINSGNALVLASHGASVADVKAVVDDIAARFASFRGDNDRRFADLETELKSQNTRFALARHGDLSGSFEVGVNREEVAMFANFVRGDIRNMSTDSKPDGGFLVPTTVEAGIARLARDAVTLRSVARVVPVDSDSYTRVVSHNGPTASWVSERQTRLETSGMNLSEQETPLHELQAMPAVTQKLIDDARVNIAAELSEEIATAFAEKENLAFISGNGVKQPRGLLGYPIVANGSHAWGKIGYLTTGDSGGFVAASATVSPADKLIDLVYALKAGYRARAVWLMNSQTAGTIRKLKDAEGKFIWAESIEPNTPSRLLGYPVVIEEGMPAFASNEYPIAFGDFSKGYTILDRLGIRVLRDPFSMKPYVLFYTTKRVGGFVSDFNSYKLLKVAS